MDAYLYQAALYCEECASQIKADITGSDESVPLAMDWGDSEYWPQGPYADGGGEADTPQHCYNCSLFLKNPLTTDGYEYVAETIEIGTGKVVEEWRTFYGGDTDLF